MNQVNVIMHSVNGVKAKVVKGSENRHVTSNMDANSMAQLEADRIREQQMIKKEKIQSFMNSTRMNATRLYKQQCDKNLQQMNNKKQILGKQKQLKAKYTVIPKKNEKDQKQSITKLPKQPIQVNWKQAEQVFKGIHVPVQNCQAQDSSDCESGYDSEIDREKNQTPQQINSIRLKIRKQMLQKYKKQ